MPVETHEQTYAGGQKMRLFPSGSVNIHFYAETVLGPTCEAHKCVLYPTVATVTMTKLNAATVPDVQIDT